ncbi:MAG: carbohydrate kinase [Ruminiclostridium sp.]|nr:carbohydrate kinase [Ruminiclostridium sp.]
MRFKPLSYGAVLWDIIDGREHIGGAPFNLAAHLAKFGCSSSIITRIGKDKRGEKALAMMKNLGVDTSFVQTDPKHDTGIAEVTLTGLGVPAFNLPENAAYEFIDANDQIIERIDKIKFDVLCFGTLEQKNTVSRNSLYRILESLQFKNIFFDVNIRLDFFPEEIIRKSFSHSTIVKLNEGEARLLSQLLYGRFLDEKEFVRRVIDEFSINVICITKGKDGCSVYSGNTAASYPEHVVKVVDTVGAGDAFSAAFLAHYQKSGDPFESARLGNIMGAYVASQHGAIPEYTEEIRKLTGMGKFEFKVI